jgi:uncharacterized protein (DUF58 family)
VTSLLAGPYRRARDAWRRIRAWRRISFTSGGLVFTLGALAIGFAAMNTGNNLLYLLLGGMLGFIIVSGWLSEQVIRGLHVRRRLPRAVTVGHELRIAYVVTNRHRALPSLAVEIGEAGLPGRAFVAHVRAGGSARTRSLNSFVRRGVYPLETVTLSTSFPFGMFRKERDLALPGEIVVWPRSDRPVPTPLAGGGRRAAQALARHGMRGHRGEYRSLRTYRPDDDSRDIHWRSSARLRDPVVREYERDSSECRWICLDLSHEPGDAAEAAVEVAASLAAQAVAENRPFGLVAGESKVGRGEGPGQLERVLDVLARVDFSRSAPPTRHTSAPEECVLVSVGGAPGFGSQIVVGPSARPREPALRSTAGREG